VWRWSACALSPMGILLLEYAEGADHRLGSLTVLKWKDMWMYMGAEGMARTFGLI